MAITDERGVWEESKSVVGAVERRVRGKGERWRMEWEKAKKYRRMAATFNYLSLDRPDLQYANNRVGCRM